MPEHFAFCSGRFFLSKSGKFHPFALRKASPRRFFAGRGSVQSDYLMEKPLLGGKPFVAGGSELDAGGKAKLPCGRVIGAGGV